MGSCPLEVHVKGGRTRFTLLWSPPCLLSWMACLIEALSLSLLQQTGDWTPLVWLHRPMKDLSVKHCRGLQVQYASVRVNSLHCLLRHWKSSDAPIASLKNVWSVIHRYLLHRAVASANVANYQNEFALLALHMTSANMDRIICPALAASWSISWLQV